MAVDAHSADVEPTADTPARPLRTKGAVENLLVRWIEVYPKES